MKTIKESELMNMVGALVKVSNMSSPSSGREVPNQFNLTFEHGCGFQSYSSLIGIIYNGQVYLTVLHDYSSTTSKYCSQWLGYNTAERRKKLANEEYILIEND